ncbi:hypothetical protein BAE44_0005133 [Dichanthelium oligosanthes]|uniref:F-box domain-containing protein n=1 Tax=Dichanthelium oligosanthes TaxID=888268 RepID=A0A1E5W9D7_9POAL|nr:hypothetical protein BAE44_0005133 [Dichanthelium oligosanthes]
METTTEVAALPHDALAHVFRCLPARSVADARSVCKAWRAIVDARALLLRHRELLPHYVHGVFVNYIDHCRPHLFARPFPASCEIDSMLGFLPTDEHWDWWSVLDHCRGLVLCDIERGGQLCVCNPATRRWTLVPSQRARWRDYTSAYLTFDPAISLTHYEILLIPTDPEKPQPALEVRLHGVDDERFCLDAWLQFLSSDVAEEEEGFRQQQLHSADEDMELNHVDDRCRLTEWPPTPWTLDVFSSSSGRWEQRTFVRQGEPVATVQDMRLDQPKPTWRGPRQRYAAYWQGALYVHCRGDIKKNTSAKPYLGISEKGVYYGIVQECQLGNGRQMDAPWIVHDVDDTDNASEALVKERFEWDSDSDDIFTIEAGSTEEYYGAGFDILGFHPYKEVVFLADHFRVVAYHLNTSKVQYLGNSRPKSYYHNYTNDIYESFVYTPCMIGELNKGSTMKEN